jgi:hypothetical protein
MSLNIKSMSAAGAAVLLVFAATGALAQNPPRSTKRIPISKEAGGEVVRVDTLVRIDTVTNTIYRTDTLTRTMTRIDTVVVAPPPVPIRLPAGFYAGLAAGTSSPDGSIFIPNSTGFLGQMHIGWQNAKQFLGGRISGTYTDLGQDSQFSQGVSAQLWTMSTDLKLNLPLGRVFGLTPRLNAYGIGGWTYTWFRNLPHRLDAVNINTNNDVDLNVAAFRLGEDSWTGRNGWDAGGGLSLMWGRSEVFVESRVLGFSISNSPSARQVPVVFGFNWY